MAGYCDHSRRRPETDCCDHARSEPAKDRDVEETGRCRDVHESCEKKVPEIETALDTLAKTVAVLDDGIRELEGRLWPVLRYVDDTGSPKCPIRETSTPLGKALGDRIDSIDAIHARVRDVIERLEI